MATTKVKGPKRVKPKIDPLKNKPKKVAMAGGNGKKKKRA